MSESINVRMAKVPDLLTSRELRPLLESILTDLAAIKTAVNTHTHDGVTVGSGTSGAANANTVGTLNTQE
jgi:hypothetical protein